MVPSGNSDPLLLLADNNFVVFVLLKFGWSSDDLVKFDL
jgi:hypothetical protein